MAARPSRRPGGRSARVRALTLAATIGELAESGYSALTLDAVARRAGVHRTTLYRRWGTREALVLDAMLEHVRVEVPVPDTGSLRDDLLALASAGGATASAPAGGAVVRAVVAAGAHDPALAAASRQFWAERLALDGAIVTRAIERGEVPPGTDPEAVIEAVLGPVYFRLLVTGTRPDPEFIERIVDFVAAGVSGERRAPRARS
jgi:AcrR family transcriptional regulator